MVCCRSNDTCASYCILSNKGELRNSLETINSESMNQEFRKKLGIDENKPNDWFENLYAVSNNSGDGIPWANMDAHPLFKNWIRDKPNVSGEQTALVVGCGLGDDAIAL